MNIDNREQLDSLVFDDRGLVPVVAQHATTGEVLMVAYASRAALERTLESGTMWYYSRSRGALWHKGETSGNTQTVVQLCCDCDGDAVLARVHPAGPACHTGARNCFGTAPTLSLLADLIEQRARDLPENSYTTRLLEDANLRLKKLGEEATELALACHSGNAARVAEESADLLYHVLVAGAAAGVSLQQVLDELERRSAFGGPPPRDQ
jgi:phosphoribosyl-ATP pyrophosphohydrolase/phosphoribosyl-AMP cyclohydrolase